MLEILVFKSPACDEQVDQFQRFVLRLAASLFPGIEGSCAGSFRRGRSECGDIDLILTHPSWIHSPYSQLRV